VHLKSYYIFVLYLGEICNKYLKKFFITNLAIFIDLTPIMTNLAL